MGSSSVGVRLRRQGSDGPLPPSGPSMANNLISITLASEGPPRLFSFSVARSHLRRFPPKAKPPPFLRAKKEPAPPSQEGDRSRFPPPSLRVSSIRISPPNNERRLSSTNVPQPPPPLAVPLRKIFPPIFLPFAGERSTPSGRCPRELGPFPPPSAFCEYSRSLFFPWN